MHPPGDLPDPAAPQRHPGDVDSGVDAGRGQPGTPDGTRRVAGRAALVLAAAAVLVAAADTYVVVLALPDMMVGVGLDVDELQRAAPIVSVFLLGYVALLPLVGSLSDRHGRVPVLVGALACFAVGSVVTAAAPDLATVVAGRFLQGVGGGGLVPVTLALVADLYPPHARGLPLGLVGAVQEAGTVLGPLAGAAVLAVADWRAIFWLNLAVAVALAAGLLASGRGVARPGSGLRRDPWGAALLAVSCGAALLVLLQPRRLVEGVTTGQLFVPILGDSASTSPLVLLLGTSSVAFVVRELTARRPLVDVRALPTRAREADLVGAVLVAVALGGVVLAFATSDATVQVLSDRAAGYLGVSAAAAVVLVVQQRRRPDPVLPLGRLKSPAAWGALLVSTFLGAALIAVLVQVPVYARTALTGETQLDAALELLRFLVGLPVGALLGGWAIQRIGPGPLAAAGMAVAAGGLWHMTGWDVATIAGRTDDAVLLATGVGMGVAIPAVNASLLAAVAADVHGRASALLVVARTVGKLVGLSVLTAVGLRTFTRAQSAVPSPAVLCPDTPLRCPAYAEGLQGSLLAQIHGTIGGAAVCAALAALLALLLLPRRAHRDASRAEAFAPGAA